MSEEKHLPDFDQLWDYANPATTRDNFHRLLSQAEAVGDRDYIAQLCTQIARTHGLQGEFAAAHALLDDVYLLLPEGMSLAKVRYLLERGRAFNSAGEREQASVLFHEAWPLAAQLGADNFTIDALHMLAIVAPPDEQISWNLQALALAEQTADPRARRWLGSLYNNLGWSYHDLADYETALVLFQKAQQQRAEQGDRAGEQIAHWTIARTLRSLGRVAEAFAMQQTLLAEHEANGAEDGYVQEELAECLYALGRLEEARPYFAQAYALLSSDSWLARHQAARLERLQALSVL